MSSYPFDPDKLTLLIELDEQGQPMIVVDYGGQTNARAARPYLEPFETLVSQMDNEHWEHMVPILAGRARGVAKAHMNFVNSKLAPAIRRLEARRSKMLKKAKPKPPPATIRQVLTGNEDWALLPMPSKARAFDTMSRTAIARQYGLVPEEVARMLARGSSMFRQGEVSYSAGDGRPSVPRHIFVRRFNETDFGMRVLAYVNPRAKAADFRKSLEGGNVVPLKR